jgi:hypothetical protein
MSASSELKPHLILWNRWANASNRLTRKYTTGACTKTGLHTQGVITTASAAFARVLAAALSGVQKAGLRQGVRCRPVGQLHCIIAL